MAVVVKVFFMFVSFRCKRFFCPQIDMIAATLTGCCLHVGSYRLIPKFRGIASMGSRFWQSRGLLVPRSLLAALTFDPNSRSDAAYL